jgi:23S rRNA (cytidine2498-2'-O)-methyltransferase
LSSIFERPKQLCIISKDHKLELLDELKYLRLTVLGSTPTTVRVLEDHTEPAWAQCVWRNVQTLEITSVGDAQKKLEAISPRWMHYGDAFNRRGALIAEKLNIRKENRAFKFPTRGERNPHSAYTLIGPDLILYSQEIFRPNPDGEISFIEDRDQPPSRAYLKLWEALTVIKDWPRKGETVVDLGSSPGSWSWALAELDVAVLSIDRSELAENLRGYKNITFTAGDAFGFQPRKMDWVFSDVICYPEKLYEYVSSWIQSGLCNKFICSVKFAGKADPEIIDRFRKLPNSRILHLFHNKNEVTWISHPSLKTVTSSKPG